MKQGRQLAALYAGKLGLRYLFDSKITEIANYGRIFFHELNCSMPCFNEVGFIVIPKSNKGDSGNISVWILVNMKFKLSDTFSSNMNRQVVT